MNYLSLVLKNKQYNQIVTDFVSGKANHAYMLCSNDSLFIQNIAFSLAAHITSSTINRVESNIHPDVFIYGKNGKDKLTHAGIYGVDTSIKTIENLLDIDINYYLKVNFSTLVNFIDIIEGINVYSAYTFDTYGIKFYEGYNYLNGEQALAFSFFLYNFSGGDRVRGENQMRVIEAIINKLSSLKLGFRAFQIDSK